VPTFQNPTGTVLPGTARRRLVETAEARRVPVIDDQVLAELAFEATQQPPGLAWYHRGAPIVSVGSLSKLVWGGLRLGWVRAVAQTVAEIARLKAISDLGTDVLTQAVAVALFGPFGRGGRGSPAGVARAPRPACEPPAHVAACVGVRRAEGGQTFWVRLPGCDTGRFAQIALRHGVAVLEESSLAVVPSGGEHLRLPVTLPPETLAEAVVRLKAVWLEYRRLVCGSEAAAASPHVMVDRRHG